MDHISQVTATKVTATSGSRVLTLGEELNKLYEEKKYTQVFQPGKELADAGNPFWQNRIGIMYEQSRGVQQDYSEAARYYKKAAHQGSIDALTNLGSLYQHGLGVQQDYSEAAEYYEKAGKKGSVTACNNMGFLYHHGLGVKQSDELAKQWYRKSTDLNGVIGNYNLFTILHLGPDGKKTNGENWWYDSKAKDPEFLNRKAAYYKEQETKADIYLALEHYPAAFTQFYCLARTKMTEVKDKLVQMCLGDKVTSEDNLCLAIAFFKKEHENGDPRAAFLVAKLTMAIPPHTLLGISHANILTALKWYKKAASGEKGAANFDGQASYHLAMLLHEYNPGSDKAREHFKNAHTQGCARAIKEIFSLSEKYRKSYENSLIFKNEDDLLIATDLLEFAVKADYSPAKTRSDEIQLLQTQKASENSRSFFNWQSFTTRTPNEFDVTDDHL